MIDESEICFVGRLLAAHPERMESDFIFKHDSSIYTVVDSSFFGGDDISGDVWIHMVRLATREEQITYEVMQT
jgi:hypothetical protein